MLASTVSSKLLRAMAKAEGFNFIETLTGFKWMGNRSHELINDGKTVLFAFEEAIGFMFAPTVLDKDGVSAACHLASLAAFLKIKNLTLFDKLNELYERYGFHYTSNSYFLCYEADVIAKIFERIRNFQQAPNTVNHFLSICRHFQVEMTKNVTFHFFSLQNYHFFHYVFSTRLMFSMGNIRFQRYATWQLALIHAKKMENRCYRQVKAVKWSRLLLKMELSLH